MNARTFFSDRPIAYHPILAKVCKSVTAALFLSQIAYWNEKGASSDGWIWKTQSEMANETGLSRSEQETARRILRELGVLKEELRGVPARMWYLIDWECLENLLSTYSQTSMQESSKLESGKPANKQAENLQTIQRLSENTSKTTTTKSDASVVVQETEKESAAEDKVALAFREYQRVVSFGFSPTMADKIREAVADVPIQCVKYAFDQAEANNVKKWNYVSGVLDKLRANGWQMDTKRNGNGPPLKQPKRYAETWVQLQCNGPGESLPVCFERLKKEGRVEQDAVMWVP